MSKLFISLFLLITTTLFSFENYIGKSEIRIYENVTDEQFLKILKSHPTPEKIKEIYSEDCGGITDRSFMEISKRCPALESFYMHGHITDEGIEYLVAGCPNLKSLGIPLIHGKGGITDKGLITLSEAYPFLEGINLRGHSAITDKGVTSLAINCPNLFFLDVTGKKKRSGLLTDQSLFALAEYCKNLKVLMISGHGVTIEGAKAVLKRCKSLELIFSSLKESECEELRRLWPDVIVNLSKFNPNIFIDRDIDDEEFMEILSQPDPGMVKSIIVQTMLCGTDRSLSVIGNQYTQLKRLKISGNRITDEGIKAIAAGCPELRDLSLRVLGEDKGCITDSGVESLFQGCPLLSHIDLSGHTDITDKGVTALSMGCPNLVSLSAAGKGKKNSGKLTDQTLFALGENSQRLMELFLSHNPGITFEGVAEILKSSKTLYYIDIHGTSITKKEHKKLCEMRDDVMIMWESNPNSEYYIY